MHYTIPYPFKEFKSARKIRTSPLYEKLKLKGACFGSKSGWERVNVFSKECQENYLNLLNSFKMNDKLIESIKKEHINTRENVTIFDQTSLSKILIQGKDSLKALNFICSGKIDVEINKIIYTPILNEKGNFESCLTITRMGEDSFLIISPTNNFSKDFGWINEYINKNNLNAVAVDVTSSYVILSLMGPNSGKLLTEFSQEKEDFSNKVILYYLFSY